jgi:hypothetical protein
MPDRRNASLKVSQLLVWQTGSGFPKQEAATKEAAISFSTRLSKSQQRLAVVVVISRQS